MPDLRKNALGGHVISQMAPRAASKQMVMLDSGAAAHVACCEATWALIGWHAMTACGACIADSKTSLRVCKKVKVESIVAGIRTGKRVAV